MIRDVFLILCLFGGPLLAANDFSGDESCLALWRFENGALTTTKELLPRRSGASRPGTIQPGVPITESGPS
jgi:hypothetical protein